MLVASARRCRARGGGVFPTGPRFGGVRTRGLGATLARRVYGGRHRSIPSVPVDRIFGKDSLRSDGATPPSTAFAKQAAHSSEECSTNPATFLRFLPRKLHGLCGSVHGCHTAGRSPLDRRLQSRRLRHRTFTRASAEADGPIASLAHRCGVVGQGNGMLAHLLPRDGCVGVESQFHPSRLIESLGKIRYVATEPRLRRHVGGNLSVFSPAVPVRIPAVAATGAQNRRRRPSEVPLRRNSGFWDRLYTTGRCGKTPPLNMRPGGRSTPRKK